MTLKKGSYYISSDTNEIIYILEENATSYYVEKYEYSKSKAEGQKVYLPKEFVDFDKKLAKAGYRELSKKEYKKMIMLLDFCVLTCIIISS